MSARPRRKKLRPLSDRDRLVLKHITDCAAAGDPCLTNVQIVRLIGAPQPATGGVIIDRLEAHGLIAVERFVSARRVTIISTGCSTAPVEGRTKCPPRDLNKPKREYRRGVRAEGVDCANLLRVERDACFKCGTRADVGCRHHPLSSDRCPTVGAPGVSPLPAPGAILFVPRHVVENTHG